MDKDIKVFLDNYSCKETRPNHWEGTFTKTRTLHKVRDNLTAQTWTEITDLAAEGFNNMPINLRNSANRKFNDFENWQFEMDMEGYTFPQILTHYKGTRHYRKVQQLTWGVLTSMIEAIWHIEEEVQSNELFEYV